MIGSAAGFLGVANLLSYVLETYPEPSVCVFVGLIVGMLPSLWREAGEQGRNVGNVILSCVTLVAMLSLLFWLQNSQNTVEPGFFSFLFCGFAFALSVIAPGMSFSTILMPLGLYTPFVEGIGHVRLEVLLPGVLQMGTYDEELVAVPLSVAVITLVTSRDYWQEDSWTTEDILSIMQDQSEPSGLFLDITGQDTYDYNMYYLIGMDIGNSPFIKDGNCRFDSEEFRELLTLVKEMTQKANNSSSPTNRFTPLIEGEYLGIGYYMYNMKALCDIYDKMGDNANLVGYPSDTGSCQYLSDYGVLVVNHTAMEKAGVKELVNYLLSLESQQMLSYEISVRLDIPESQVVYNSAGNNYFWQFPNNKGYALSSKEDGSSYLEEYLELLESAVPTAVSSDDIFDIVMEEANGYFQGDKDLDSVVDVIQRRVQLYLDERK